MELQNINFSLACEAKIHLQLCCQQVTVNIQGKYIYSEESFLLSFIIIDILQGLLVVLMKSIGNSIILFSWPW